MPNELMYPAFALNWLPRQRSLRNRRNRSRSIIYELIPIILGKIVKIGPVDPEIIGLQEIV